MLIIIIMNIHKKGIIGHRFFFSQRIELSTTLMFLQLLSYHHNCIICYVNPAILLPNNKLMYVCMYVLFTKRINARLIDFRQHASSASSAIIFISQFLRLTVRIVAFILATSRTQSSRFACRRFIRTLRITIVLIIILMCTALVHAVCRTLRGRTTENSAIMRCRRGQHLMA